MDIKYRRTLKQILDYVNRARALAGEIPVEGEAKGDIAQMVNGLISAENRALILWDAYPIRSADEDKASLNSAEEAIFHALPAILKFSPSLMDQLSHEQKFSAARVIHKQGGPDKIRHPVGFSVEYLGISFHHIFIGIEKDGYAHS